MPLAAPRCALALCLLTALAACAPTKPTERPEAPPAPAAERLDAAPIIDRHNQRVAQLDRLWARGIVAVRYIDDEGDKRYEQGDSHLQRLDGDKLALSVTKLGETYFWFGADAERYWVFDLASGDQRILYHGQLALASPEKAAWAGLPVLPSDWLHLAGLRTIDAPPSLAIATRGEDGATLLELPRGDAEAWRFRFDPTTGRPTRVELLDPDQRVILRSTLEDDRSVIITGQGGDYPKMPATIRLEHLPSETSINVVIDGDPIDGRRTGKPKPRVFDLDFLIDALGPIDRVVDLDEPEPGP